MVRNPLLGSLGDNFKMRVKGITGHRYVSHSTVSVDGRRRRSSQKKLSLMCPSIADFDLVGTREMKRERKRKKGREKKVKVLPPAIPAS